MSAGHPYSTLTDLQNRIADAELIALTNDTVNATTINTSLVSAQIERADTIIDNYISQVYSVPLDIANAANVVQLSADLTAYFIWQRRPLEVKMPDEIEKNYKTAMEVIKMIGDEQIPLIGATPVDIESPEAKIVSNPRQIDFNDPNNVASRF